MEGERMKAWLIKYKGYLLHAGAMGLVFLDPSVNAFILAHPAYAFLGGTLWGSILHWAKGK
jgi:hypothetical protein